MIIHSRENQIEIAAPAKVNLFLELLNRRRDGFHEIETVMSSVSIFDHLRFTRRKDSKLVLSIGFTDRGTLAGEQDTIPTDHRNLVLKALQLVRSTASNGLESESCGIGIQVDLQKNIPSAAGLGGASSDAAAALVAANHIWKLNWPAEKLSELASRLGSDVGFFLFGGTAICRGRGELVTPIRAGAQLPIVVAKPQVALSTADVYGNVTLTGTPRGSEELVQSVRRHDSATLGESMFNRLQQFAEPLNQQFACQLARLRREFTRLNCLGHQMSGSGSSYFGVFSNARVARLAARQLTCRLPDVRIFFSQTLTNPVPD